MRARLLASSFLVFCLAACRADDGHSLSSPDGVPTAFDDEPAPEAVRAPDPSVALAASVPSSRPRPAAGGIYRSEIERATAGYRPAYLLRQLQPVAYRPQGRFQGWQIGRVFPDDPELCSPGCNLRAGDIVLSVNGSRLERPEQLSDLVGKLRTAERLDVRLIRDGKLVEASYPIVADEG